MSVSVFTGWKSVTPGDCSNCGLDDEWSVDGRGNILCSCQACPDCGIVDAYNFHEAGCVQLEEGDRGVMTIALAKRSLPNTGSWQDRHNLAMLAPSAGFEYGIVRMLEGWHRYAQIHQQRYESPIGDDGVLGPAWQAIGQALLGLLNGETGRLDCGTLDEFIRATLTANGAEVD